MSAQSILQDRICDLFGLSIAGAYRYTATVDHPGVAAAAKLDRAPDGANDE